MKIVTTIAEFRQVRRGYGFESVGFVPTMGYLHEGHLELIRRARTENERVVASIFVNPKQFSPTEDLSRYPRDLDRDFHMLAGENVDLVFVPSNEVMYPPDYQTTVSVSRVTQALEGLRRPTHFDGVTTVVAKLFNIVQPSRAYFGQKDAQQSVVIRQMVRDLNFDLEIVVCPTVRESDGLAMSSRNKYLTEDERKGATVLYKALQSAKSIWDGGTRNSGILRAAMMETLSEELLARVDYISAADPVTLEEWHGEIPRDSGLLLSMAVFFGQTRLIDNLLLE
ncbi:MAG: pantoate--beta-alanine ligase [Anaerolineae bacterium]|nr:pantoate--beta-alanine ligase [Anaerolineae bacterium]RIK24263.1 MAG: pantoate--beta-alanine ligase [Anaerolineae bacterium]